MDNPVSYAADLMTRVCVVSGHASYLTDLRETMRANGVAHAVRRHNSLTLIDWLVEAVSYQGISDAIATRYMDEHGRVSARQVQAALQHGPSCPRLQSFAQFEGCRFAKTARSCAEPEHIDGCPLPKHDLRNGRLNQVAYALTLFVRDVCDGDLVAWIDGRLAGSVDHMCEDQALLWRGALLEPLSQISGLSYKVLSMSLADLLLGAGHRRAEWMQAGSGMVAVDILVHNWLARTGILRGFGAEHPYGPACYRQGHCAAIIDLCAHEIDARQFCACALDCFPRLVQHAIWYFGAANGLDCCNGNQVDDRFGCERGQCICHPQCERIAIGQVRYTE